MRKPAIGLSSLAAHMLSVEISQKRSKEPKSVLRGINLVALPGRIFAIMGPSGSGKTTLLNLLGGRTKHVPEWPPFFGRNRSMQIRGNMYLNGQLTNAAILREKSRYVMQRDELMPFLTVEETLYFAAQLKLHHISRENRIEKVESALNKLSLKSCRNVFVGNEVRKGISGGQKKRLCIAIELLDDPPLILLDEPTSGLDSSLAFDVFKILRELAKGGRTIITTIHQPRSQIFHMFDDLLLLWQGQIVYQGVACEAIDHMRACGFPCPPNFSTSDFLLDLLTPTSQKTELFEEEFLKPPSRAWSNAWYAKETRVDCSGRLSSRDSSQGWRTLPAQHMMAEDRSRHTDDKCTPSSALSSTAYIVQESLVSTPMMTFAVRGRMCIAEKELQSLPEKYAQSKYAAEVNRKIQRLQMEPHRNSSTYEIACAKRTRGYWHSVLVLLHRNAKDKSRNPGAMVLMNLLTCWLACIAGFNVLGAMAFTPLQLSFGVMAVIIDIPSERPLLNREVAAGMYNLSAWYIARNVSDFPFYVLTVCLHVLIVYWMVDYRRDPGTTAFYFLAAIINTFSAISFMLMTATLAKSPIMVALIAPGGIILVVLTSGFWISEAALPAFWSWFKYLSWMKYTLNAVGLKLYGGTGVLKTCALVEETSSPYTPLGYSLLLALAFRVLGYLGMRFANRQVGMQS